MIQTIRNIGVQDINPVSEEKEEEILHSIQPHQADSDD